jgi:hypothetical protein
MGQSSAVIFRERDELSLGSTTSWLAEWLLDSQEYLWSMKLALKLELYL